MKFFLAKMHLRNCADGLIWLTPRVQAEEPDHTLEGKKPTVSSKTSLKWPRLQASIVTEEVELNLLLFHTYFFVVFGHLAVGSQPLHDTGWLSDTDRGRVTSSAGLCRPSVKTARVH